MVKCLAYSAATGQAGIRTHILTTQELESNALDRSATTLHVHCYAQLRNQSILFNIHKAFDVICFLSLSCNVWWIFA